MTITTVIKHDATDRSSYLNEYEITSPVHGFRLKLLSYISQGYTDGTSTEQTVTENGKTVIVNTRTWTNQDIAQAWCDLTMRVHPSSISANVVVS